MTEAEHSMRRIRHLHRQLSELQDQRSSDSSSAMTMLGALQMRLRNLEKVVTAQEQRIRKLEGRT
jgi:hypothetical protein